MALFFVVVGRLEIEKLSHKKREATVSSSRVTEFVADWVNVFFDPARQIEAHVPALARAPVRTGLPPQTRVRGLSHSISLFYLLL